METSFPAIHLYAVLALAATLASLVATHLRSPSYLDPKSASRMAIWTCVLLVVAWGHLITTLFISAWVAWSADRAVWSHLTVHLLVIAVMLPIVCVTVVRSWMFGIKSSVQLQDAS